MENPSHSSRTSHSSPKKKKKIVNDSQDTGKELDRRWIYLGAKDLKEIHNRGSRQQNFILMDNKMFLCLNTFKQNKGLIRLFSINTRAETSELHELTKVNWRNAMNSIIAIHKLYYKNNKDI